jgi:formylmethanofuran dehydrogenase subunit B
MSLFGRRERQALKHIDNHLREVNQELKATHAKSIAHGIGLGYQIGRIHGIRVVIKMVLEGSSLNDLTSLDMIGTKLNDEK